MIVADTDVLVDFLHDKGAAPRIRLELQHGLATTAVSAFELRTGARDAKREHAVETLLAMLKVLPLDDAAAARAAAVFRRLAAKGEPIGMADSLIAGIVLERRSTLLTRNRKHFERVEGLRLGSIA